ncbi:hypothetical protein BR93DRAFT_535770 [Coniochaeta sp. PMI_546]|nr:hypothetical protein BR93DRAFT_535770 [Coniochaeta sp. PMI_546]
MCLQIIHWRFCGHHTVSWKFCQYSNIESILVREKIEQLSSIGQTDSISQELEEGDKFHQSLEKRDLTDDSYTSPSSSATASPNSSTSCSPASTKSTPTSPPSSPTSPPRTPSPPSSPPTCLSPPSPPRQTKHDHANILAPISIRRVRQRMPCTRSIGSRVDFSQFRAFCNVPGGCDYERVGRKWTCCVCGKGPNRTMNCYRTFEEHSQGDGDGQEEICGHQLCNQCEAYSKSIFHGA